MIFTIQRLPSDFNIDKCKDSNEPVDFEETIFARCDACGKIVSLETAVRMWEFYKFDDRLTNHFCPICYKRSILGERPFDIARV